MFRAVPKVLDRPEADLLVIPLFQEKGEREFAEIVDPILKMGDFSAKEGATMLLYPEGGKEKRVLLLGLGEEEKCTVEVLRRACSALMKRCRGKKWASLNLLLPDCAPLSYEDRYRGIVEGIALSSYLFEEWKAEEGRKGFSIEVVHLIGAKDEVAAERCMAIVSGVNLARDLVNGNARDVTPRALGRRAEALARDYPSITGKVLSREEIESEGMGLFLAVASGSRIDPALIELEYRGNPTSKDLTLLVGKGVTFDSGGLNLKPLHFIENQRSDMSGGAAVLGVFKAAAAIGLKINLAALVPATENAIGSGSYKPGDVYSSHSGKTVEITNTDAEGRLILADALSYGQRRFSPSTIVDMATLTGAAVVALGEERMALYSNCDSLAALCEEAGEATGERVWRMPLDVEYKRYLKSNIADLANAGSKRGAGSITAAIFLSEFIKKNTPWVHLDIAGTAFLDEPRDYNLTSATGSGVRLIIELLEKLRAENCEL